MKRRLLSIVTAVIMALTMIPALPQVDTAEAATSQPLFWMGASGLDEHVNTGDGTIDICFAGDWWHVIGFDGSGHNMLAKSGALTLFFTDMYNAGYDFNESYLDGNAYKGSTLEKTINDRWVKGLSATEKAAVIPRTLEGGSANYGQQYYDPNKIKGETVQNAYAWPLSVGEAAGLPDKLRKAPKNWYWWTRSPGYRDEYVQVIDDEGETYWYHDSDHGDVYGTGVNGGCKLYAAMDLKISSILFTNDLYRGKPTAVGADSLTENAPGTNTARVLTLKDPARSNFDASAVSLSNSGTLTIKYSNAISGDNNYISAMVTDSSDNILYYGKLAAASSGSNQTVEVETAGKWTPEGTNKLYIFNEECHSSGYVADYSSPLIEIDGSMFISQNLEGSGTKDDPYLINGSEGWNLLAELVTQGESSSDTYYRLEKNIRVSTMVGTSEHPFKGVFDGNGKTITFTSTDHPEGAAPFAHIEGASILNLHATGSITGNNQRASGLIGENKGSSTVKNCHVSSTISGSKLVGGFCIGAGNDLTITGCVFDGKITGSEQSGGFVAWGTSTLTIKDSLVVPQSGSDISGGTFCYKGSGAAALNNCLYMEPLGTAQGKMARSVTGGTDVTIGFGSGTTYDVSGITAYSTGLGYGRNFYAGKDDVISITLPQPKEGMSYEANYGTLSGSGTAYTLKLVDSDVTISRYYSKLAQLNNVSLIADVSNNGVMAQENWLKGRWPAIEGADGYRVSIFDKDSGNIITPEFEVTTQTPENGMITYDLSGRVGNRTGKIAIKVTAYTNRGITSNTAVSQNVVDLCELKVEIGTSMVTVKVLKGSNIGACITEMFREKLHTKMSIGSDGKFYFDTDNGSVQVLMFLPESPFYYDTMAEARAAAYFEPGKSTGKSVTRDVEMETMLSSDLCTNGAMHKFVMETLERKAGIGENRSGNGKWRCSVCGLEMGRKIPSVTTIRFGKTEFAYTGKAIKPAVTVKDAKGKSLVAGRDYTVSYSANTNVGTAKATVKLINSYTGEKALSFKIVKAANPMKIKAKKAVVKYSKLRKKNQTLKVSKVMKFTVKGQGKVQYKLGKVTRQGKKGTKSSKAKKYFRVAAKTGKVKVIKGLKKGTYIVRVKVKAAGNASYKASAWKTVKCKIIVR